MGHDGGQIDQKRGTLGDIPRGQHPQHYGIHAEGQGGQQEEGDQAVHHCEQAGPKIVGQQSRGGDHAGRVLNVQAAHGGQDVVHQTLPQIGQGQADDEGQDG